MLQNARIRMPHAAYPHTAYGNYDGNHTSDAEIQLPTKNTIAREQHSDPPAVSLAEALAGVHAHEE
jgi:hypothetical protein